MRWFHAATPSAASLACSIRVLRYIIEASTAVADVASGVVTVLDDGAFFGLEDGASTNDFLRRGRCPVSLRKGIDGKDPSYCEKVSRPKGKHDKQVLRTECVRK